MNTVNVRDELNIANASIIAIDSITTNKYLVVYTDFTHATFAIRQ